MTTIYIMVASGGLKHFNGRGTILCRNAFAVEPTEKQREMFLAEFKKDTGSLHDLDPDHEITIDVVPLSLLSMDEGVT